MKKSSNSYSPLLVDLQSRRKLSAAAVVISAAVLCSLAILLFHLPVITTFPITSRYPQCGHIVLVSERRHGSTWFISNAEDCLSVNGSYGDLSRNAEIWNHGKVKNITLEDAIDLVRFSTSVKLFPQALYEHGEEVRAFLEAMRELQVPVFVLRRNLETAFASLQAATKNKAWNLDNGGAVMQREFRAGKRYSHFKDKAEGYFEDMKKLMNDMGIAWNEVEYETILSQRVIFGEVVKCYVRNCNFGR